MADKKVNPSASDVIPSEVEESEVGPGMDSRVKPENDGVNSDLDLDALGQQLEDLQDQLQKARTSELRAMADYQNLVRRTQEDRMKMVQFATASVMESLLEPFDHLALAKDQLKDKGLDMVYQQFVQVLQQEGLEEIAVLGQEFDAAKMEVVGKEPAKDAAQAGKVIKVAQRGYTLQGEVLRHAKVIVGEEK